RLLGAMEAGVLAGLARDPHVGVARLLVVARAFQEAEALKLQVVAGLPALLPLLTEPDMTALFGDEGRARMAGSLAYLLQWKAEGNHYAVAHGELVKAGYDSARAAAEMEAMK